MSAIPQRALVHEVEMTQREFGQRSNAILVLHPRWLRNMKRQMMVCECFSMAELWCQLSF